MRFLSIFLAVSFGNQALAVPPLIYCENPDGSTLESTSTFEYFGGRDGDGLFAASHRSADGDDLGHLIAHCEASVYLSIVPTENTEADYDRIMAWATESDHEIGLRELTNRLVRNGVIAYFRELSGGSCICQPETHMIIGQRDQDDREQAA